MALIAKSHSKIFGERYLELIENSSDAIGLLGRTGRFEYVNREALKIFGAKNYKDLLYRPIQQVIAQEYHAPLNQCIKTAFSGETSSFQYHSKLWGDSLKWFDANFSPLRNAESKVSSVFLTLCDVSKELLVERGVKFLHGYAEKILHELPVSILIVDRDCKILFANVCFIAQIKKTKNKVLDRSIFEIFGYGVVRNLGWQKKIIYSIENRKKMPSERCEIKGNYFNCQIVPIQESIGRRFNAIILLENITQTVQMEQ